MRKFLSLCSVTVAALICNAVAGSLWNNYEDVFTDHLYEVFSSKDALQHSHEFSGNDSVSNRVLDYACAKYRLDSIAGW